MRMSPVSVVAGVDGFLDGLECDPPISDEALARLLAYIEERYAVPLPDDYVAFLRSANGADGTLENEASVVLWAGTTCQTRTPITRPSSGSRAASSSGATPRPGVWHRHAPDAQPRALRRIRGLSAQLGLRPLAGTITSKTCSRTSTAARHRRCRLVPLATAEAPSADGRNADRLEGATP